MHTLLILASVLLVIIGGYTTLALLPGVADSRQRRRLQMLVLASPAVSLGVGLLGLYHFDHRLCFLNAPAWDHVLGTAVPVAMGSVAVGATGLGLLRLGLLWWAVLRRSVTAGPEIHAMADRLAVRLGVPRPRLRVWASTRPLALTSGLRRPLLVLSTWMLQSLDARELESVLAHELGHSARRDYPVIWLATILRDAFFYLPTSWIVYRQLHAEKEIACDDLAVAATGRPLALASALAKVWHQAVREPVPGMAPAFAGPERCIEERIERLMQGANPERAAPIPASLPLRSVGISASALVSLVSLQVVGILVMLLNPMACGPASPLWRVW